MRIAAPCREGLSTSVGANSETVIATVRIMEDRHVFGLGRWRGSADGVTVATRLWRRLA